MSGGVFYKHLTDYIYPYVVEEPAFGDEYQVTQPRNGESASLWGAELAFQNRLTFLPGPLKGLGVYANYTFTDSSARFPGRDVDATLPGQSQHVGNFAVWYERFGFSARASWNFHGRYIDQVGETIADDIHYDNHTQMDVNLSQRVKGGFRLFADFLNLTNAPLRYYVGVPNRPIQEEVPPLVDALRRQGQLLMASSGPSTIFIRRIVGACAFLAAAGCLAACDRRASPGVAQEQRIAGAGGDRRTYPTAPVGVDANIDSVAVWRRGVRVAAGDSKDRQCHLRPRRRHRRVDPQFWVDGHRRGQLRCPNGILVLDDYAFVVERDNHRVQVFALPDGRPVVTFEDVDLRRLYGITGFVDGDGHLVYVTDGYERPDGTYPPHDELGRRVHRFRISRSGAGLTAAHESAFGATSGAGVLRKVETIVADPISRQLLVAEEDSAVRSLQIYNGDGQFTGRAISGWFATEPEGIALYACADAGYWIATDQSDDTSRNVFHVFDRRTRAHRGRVSRQDHEHD